MSRIIYDYRERRGSVPGLLALEGIECDAQQLAVGDYVLSERLVVERKTAADLIASIKDRRLWEQVQRLKEAYPAVVLIIEGTPTRLPAEAWKGALASILAIGSISVLQTFDAAETAEWIARLARREKRGPITARGAARKPKNPDRLLESVLGALPGISVKNAQRLLERFGTLQAVLNAPEEDLRQTPGVGPKRASALAKTFNQQWRAHPPRP